MERNISLTKMLIEELADLLNAECQLVEAFPKMAGASESSALKVALSEHWEITREHIRRLQGIFNTIGQKPPMVTCKAIKKLIKESEHVINKTEKGFTRDADIVNVAQQVEQYKITGCGRASEHAAELGHTMTVELLNKTLNEERTMNLHLNELAQYMINVQTLNSFDPHQQSNKQQGPPSKNKGGGFYVPEGRFKRGIKKRSKNTDISRFISEGNPNIQEPQEKGEDKEGQHLQNPEERGDLF